MLIASIGLIALSLTIPHQPPDTLSIQTIPSIQEPGRFNMLAELQDWKTYQQHYRVQLFDGNQATAVLPKTNPWKPRKGIYRFTVWITPQQPNNRIEIEKAEPV